MATKKTTAKNTGVSTKRTKSMLPVYKKIPKSKLLNDLFRTDLFKIDFPTRKLTKKDKDVLTGAIVSIIPGKMSFNLNTDKKGNIIPLNQLFKLQDLNESDLFVALQNNVGDTIQTLKYSNCKFRVNMNSVVNLSFSYLSKNAFGIEFDQQPKEIEVHFEYSKVQLGDRDITNNI